MNVVILVFYRKDFYISAFCSLTGRPTDKIFTEQMLICKTNLHKKIGPLSYSQPEQITFPPKPDGQTYGRTDGHTDGHKYLQSIFATKIQHKTYIINILWRRSSNHWKIRVIFKDFKLDIYSPVGMCRADRVTLKKRQNTPRHTRFNFQESLNDV